MRRHKGMRCSASCIYYTCNELGTYLDCKYFRLVHVFDYVFFVVVELMKNIILPEKRNV